MKFAAHQQALARRENAFGFPRLLLASALIASHSLSLGGFGESQALKPTPS